MQDQPISGSPTPKRVRVEGVPNLYRRIRDGAYEVGYTGTDGRWHIVTLRGAENLTQAKRVMREILGKRDVSQDVAPNRMTFGEVAAEYFEMCAASLRCACPRCGARGLRPLLPRSMVGRSPRGRSRARSCSLARSSSTRLSVATGPTIRSSGSRSRSGRRRRTRLRRAWSQPSSRPGRATTSPRGWVRRSPTFSDLGSDPNLT
jgi:hypothetical protein